MTVMSVMMGVWNLLGRTFQSGVLVSGHPTGKPRRIRGIIDADMNIGMDILKQGFL